MLPDLKRVIGGEGRALLHRFDLLHPLVEQMVTQAVLADVEISDEEKTSIRLVWNSCNNGVMGGLNNGLSS